jgi:hypothetical protein
LADRVAAKELDKGLGLQMLMVIAFVTGGGQIYNFPLLTSDEAE